MRVRRVRGKAVEADGGVPGVVYVGRPSVWGNPWVIGTAYAGVLDERVLTREDVLELFTTYAEARASGEPEWLRPLYGLDLSCWCPLAEACHADILLRMVSPSGV